jgi:microcystin-dependent protein
VFGGGVAYTSTGGTLNLTTAQAAYQRIVISGSLTNNLNVVFPSTLGGRIYLYNSCTLNGYTVTALNGSGDIRGGVVLPYGFYCPVVFAQGYAVYDSYQSVPAGVIHCFAGSLPPAGFLLCDGASISTTTYGQLFAAIGYGYGGSGSNFNIPDTRGRFLAGADNMGGTAANRLTGYTITTAGGAQSITLSTGQLPAHNHGVTDPGHNHAITDPGHNHTLVALQNGGGGSSLPGGGAVSIAPTITTSTSTTGVTINTNTTGITTQNTGSGSAITTIPPVLAINHIIRF